MALPVATGERELRGNASQAWLSKYLKQQCDHGKQTVKVGVHFSKKEYFGFKVYNSLLSLEQSSSNWFTLTEKNNINMLKAATTYTLL